ncbi:RNA-binding domain-containing protein [Streptomyces cellulosae]
MGLKGALAALEADEPQALLGLRESQWIDAKKAAYRLPEPYAVEELSKDVAAFANGGGGVIVIGVATRPDRGTEVLDQIVGVDPATVNVDQIRKQIRQRITPSVLGVRIGWSGPEDAKRVVFIDIPAQPVDRPFVVAAPVGKHGAPRADTVAVPVRDGDQTHWLPRTEIQQLLTAGVRASGLPTAQALAALVREAAAEAGAMGLRIGEGLPDQEREMWEAHQQLVAAGLGQPAGEAWSHGRAALRDLQHARAGQPGWVLCLVAGRPPVAVAAPVWQAIVDAGRADAGQDPLAAVGFPVPSAGEGGPWVLEADAQDVDLDGGSWGAGRLTRSAREGWRWQPLPRFSLHQGRSAKNWTAGQTPQLRLRALVNLPWADPGALEITKPRRQQLEQQLPSSALAGALTLLSGRRGAQLSAAHWEWGPFGNTARSVGYTCTVTAPDGSPALKAAAMLALPTTLESTVVVCAEVVVEDAAAWAAALGPGWTTRLELDEVQEVLLSAWETAAELLPGIVSDPTQLRWAAPPTTELRLTCEQPAPNGVLPVLDTFIDLEPFGPGDGGGRPEMAVTITAAPAMGRTERRDLMRQALVRMAREFGYVDADVELL